MIQYAYMALRPLLLRLNPECSHHIAMRALAVLSNLPIVPKLIHNDYSVRDSRLQQDILNLNFPNPVGLAAGFDKDAEAIEAFFSIGFGFAEAGAVTIHPQKGNSPPRLFRYSKYESLQNAMGFNNNGKLAMIKKLKNQYPFNFPLGINIGKNKKTPPEKSLDDYAELLDSLKNFCDYFVVNISSPNTPGLRDLENRKFVEKIFMIAADITTKPVFLKVSPDQKIPKLLELGETAVQNGAAGIIATNTTTNYSLLPQVRPFGGLSGKVLTEKSFEVLSALAKKLYGRTILISVGGIDSGLEAYRRIKEGASLVQIYSAMIFKGPGLVRKINNELLDLLDRDKLSSITAAVGINHRE